MLDVEAINDLKEKEAPYPSILSVFSTIKSDILSVTGSKDSVKELDARVMDLETQLS